MKKKARALKKAAGVQPLIVSAATGEGVPEVLRALAVEIEAIRATKRDEPVREATATPRGWNP